MPKQTFFNLPEEKRNVILNCAIDEFSEYGYQKSSINRIVEAAEIAKGSFYQYFKDKFDLYEQMLTETIAQPKMESLEMAQAPNMLAGLSFFDLLRMVYLRNTQLVGRNPKLIRIAIDLMRKQNSKIYERIIGRYSTEAGRFYYDFIEARKAAGEIAPEVDSWLLHHMMYGTVEYVVACIEQQGPEMITEEFCERMIAGMERILTGGIFTEGIKC